MKIVCLSNSYKEGGRCLAGIVLDENNNPIFDNLNPKWLRPISNSLHGEIPTNLVEQFNLLDIINIEITGYPEIINYQSENAFFDSTSLCRIGSYDTSKINKLCCNRSVIFGNKGKAVAKNAINLLSYSLMFVKTNKFRVIERSYTDSPYSQRRLQFYFNNIMYDFPITDPFFLGKYKLDKNILKNCKEIYLCLSLAVEWANWYYKLVASIIL
jgi:hypothetical protein